MSRGRQLLGLAVIGGLSLVGRAAYHHFRPGPEQLPAPQKSSLPRPATGLAPAPPATSPSPNNAGTSGAATAAPAAGPSRPRFTEPRAPSAAPHRYVGTVSGQPVTAELNWERPDSVAGRFYFWRRNAEYSLTSPSRRSAQVLAVSRALLFASQASGQWRLAQPLGPVLQGTWVDAAGRRRPFRLRENYQGGVRYEILASTLTLPLVARLGQSPEYRHDFLHLLGPPAGRPPLRRAQCPPRARRQQFVRDFPHDGEVFCTYVIEVLLNDFQLLSYQTTGVIDPFEGQNDSEMLHTLVDLTTGRELTIEDQLRPGYETPLRRLLSSHLLHDPGFTETEEGGDGWHWQDEQGQPTKLVRLPSDYEGLALASQGLQATYSPYSLRGGGGDRLPGYKVLVPYRELRPLVRPGTPLARMLRARGLW